MQETQTTTSTEQPVGGLPNPAVASERSMQWRHVVWKWSRRKFEMKPETSSELLRTAWVVAVWKLIKETANKAPSLLALLACQKIVGSGVEVLMTGPGACQTQLAQSSCNHFCYLDFPACWSNQGHRKQSSTVRGDWKWGRLGVYFRVELYVMQRKTLRHMNSC